MSATAAGTIPAYASTVSIVARCQRTGQLGVAAVTAVLGVGKLVPHAWAGVGAVATQALVNPYHAHDGLRLMHEGMRASEALEQALALDPERERRQTAMVDGRGEAAAWTGSQNLPWAGHLTRPGVSVQENRLIGPDALDSMLETYLDCPDELSLVERILRALEAGERSGADRDGALSAALLVVDTEWYPLWDLRIDHADDPVLALRELCEVSMRDLLPHVLALPKRADRLSVALKTRGPIGPR